mgnify:FL=1
MIYLSIILDILMYNYTSLKSFFFIRYLYNKSIIYYICSGIFLDIIIFHSFFINTIILIIIYFINKLFKYFNKSNYIIYLIINLFNIILFIILTNLCNLNSIKYTLILIGNSLIINILFLSISYKEEDNLI